MEFLLALNCSDSFRISSSLRYAIKKCILTCGKINQKELVTREQARKTKTIRAILEINNVTANAKQMDHITAPTRSKLPIGFRPPHLSGSNTSIVKCSRRLATLSTITTEAMACQKPGKRKTTMKAAPNRSYP